MYKPQALFLNAMTSQIDF